MNREPFDYSKPADCGHMVPRPPATGSTGYATDWQTGATRCYACAHEYERACLLKREPMGAYLSSDGRTVTTWTGGRLADVVESHPVRVFGSGDRFSIRACDVHGGWWYARGAAPCMVLTLRPMKPPRRR